MTWSRCCQLAAQGDAEAQCELGHRYYLSKGVKENYTEAMKWYLLSAEQGYGSAMRHGEPLLPGQGPRPGLRKSPMPGLIWRPRRGIQRGRAARRIEGDDPRPESRGAEARPGVCPEADAAGCRAGQPAAAAPPLEEVQSLVDRGDSPRRPRRGQPSDRQVAARLRGHRLRAYRPPQPGDLAGALEDGDRAVELDPANARALGGRANTKRQLKDTPGAAADLDRALAVNPGYHQGYDARAAMRLEAGDTAGALADSSRAVELSPQMASYLIRRASIHTAMKNPAAATADLTRAIALDPKALLAYAKRSLFARRRAISPGRWTIRTGSSNSVRPMAPNWFAAPRSGVASRTWPGRTRI